MPVIQNTTEPKITMSTANILYITGEAVFGTIVIVLLVVVIVKRGPCAKRQPEEAEPFNI